MATLAIDALFYPATPSLKNPPATELTPERELALCRALPRFWWDERRPPVGVHLCTFRGAQNKRFQQGDGHPSEAVGYNLTRTRTSKKSIVEFPQMRGIVASIHQELERATPVLCLKCGAERLRPSRLRSSDAGELALLR